MLFNLCLFVSHLFSSSLKCSFYDYEENPNEPGCNFATHADYSERLPRPQQVLAIDGESASAGEAAFATVFLGFFNGYGGYTLLQDFFKRERVSKISLLISSPQRTSSAYENGGRERDGKICSLTVFFQQRELFLSAKFWPQRKMNHK